MMNHKLLHRESFLSRMRKESKGKEKKVASKKTKNSSPRISSNLLEDEVKRERERETKTRRYNNEEKFDSLRQSLQSQFFATSLFASSSSLCYYCCIAFLRQQK